jgi:hypothetical protein
MILGFIPQQRRCRAFYLAKRPEIAEFVDSGNAAVV